MSDKFASEYEARQYLLCDGSTFDTTKYKKLYKVLGTNRLPNLQGVFLRGYGTQGTYSSGQLGQIQGDAMRKIYGDIPSVQFGDGAFGQYTPGAFQLSGHTTNKSYSYGETLWCLPNLKNYRYRLSGNKESGYSLVEQETDDNYYIQSRTARWLDLIPNPSRPINLNGVIPTSGNWSEGASYLYKAFRTVTLDSSKIVPTDTEVRPANFAVKYFIRAK